MEANAIIRFQDLEESGQLTDCEAFIKFLLVIFGPSVYDDPMEAITRLNVTPEPSAKLFKKKKNFGFMYKKLI